MNRTAVIGGETHLHEITRLEGSALTIVASSMREELRAAALPDATVPNFEDAAEMLREMKPDMVAISNENDLKFPAVMQCLEAGCDVAVDKPLCLTVDQQDQLERTLVQHHERRLLNLLSLRGDPPWIALREQVRAGAVGTPALVHVRMAVRLKRAQRPPWFLDVRRSGGLFLDLLIHGLDQVEWLSGAKITSVTAATGNLGDPADANLRDHASVYCELDSGAAALVEGQRMLPDTQGSDYRVLIAGSQGFADLVASPASVRVTNPEAADRPVEDMPQQRSIVADWLANGAIVPQAASLRANRLALFATLSAENHERIAIA